MLLALSDVTYVLIGWFKFLLLKFLHEYGPWGNDLIAMFNMCPILLASECEEILAANKTSYLS